MLFGAARGGGAFTYPHPGPVLSNAAPVAGVSTIPANLGVFGTAQAPVAEKHRVESILLHQLQTHLRFHRMSPICPQKRSHARGEVFRAAEDRRH